MTLTGSFSANSGPSSPCNWTQSRRTPSITRRISASEAFTNTPTAAEAFYRIVDAACEQRSVVTSNIHPSGFDTIAPKPLATATVDRLLRHAHLVGTSGDSHCLAEALTGKGVTPPL
ncbi:hypothetical protein AB0B45_33010 [Nonomuraea sp. NPDC049152]|uniref:hypothetical protein n=1 Tax=Nonomuraea sp. NPDC049152 TaxID=3154350 RepID=UPI0033DE175C